MEFKLSAKEKLSVYKQTRKSFEIDLIQRLCAVGIDPEDFNSKEFTPEEDKMSHSYIKELLLKIEKVEEKILQFEILAKSEEE
jgi:hypothetical protein